MVRSLTSMGFEAGTPVIRVADRQHPSDYLELPFAEREAQNTADEAYLEAQRLGLETGSSAIIAFAGP